MLVELVAGGGNVSSSRPPLQPPSRATARSSRAHRTARTPALHVISCQAHWRRRDGAAAYHCCMANRATGIRSDEAPTMTVLQARRDEIVDLAAAHGASNVRVFGSVARGTSEAGSDIDLLVDFEPGRTLVDQIGLWRDLEALLGVSVDVVSARGL